MSCQRYLNSIRGCFLYPRIYSLPDHFLSKTFWLILIGAVPWLWTTIYQETSTALRKAMHHHQTASCGSCMIPRRLLAFRGLQASFDTCLPTTIHKNLVNWLHICSINRLHPPWFSARRIPPFQHSPNCWSDTLVPWPQQLPPITYPAGVFLKRNALSFCLNQVWGSRIQYPWRKRIDHPAQEPPSASTVMSKCWS